MEKFLEALGFFHQYAGEVAYQVKTTFWQDLTLAEPFGLDAVQDTYNTLFDMSKNDYILLTELVFVLNLKIWYYHETNIHYARLYDSLWRETDSYACDTLTGEELTYFYRTLD